MAYKIVLNDGKYTILNSNGKLGILRYNEDWPAANDLRHSGLVLALVQRIEELEQAQSIKPIDDFSKWFFRQTDLCMEFHSDPRMIEFFKRAWEAGVLSAPIDKGN